MDIRKYLGKRTHTEQSDKSSGEESDTEESFCRADKSRHSWPAPFYLHNRRRNVTKKESLGESLSLGLV